jgi:ABC-type antimicrobial peptide transport system permease subunit
MLGNGIETALSAGGNASNAVLLQKGSLHEIVSIIDRETVLSLSTLPELATSLKGEPLLTGELVVLVALPRDKAHANIAVRGITPMSFEARPNVRISEGRKPRSGTNEVVLGAGLEDAYIGGELSFANQQWPIVGRLSAEGSAFETEIWVDGNRLANTFGRTGFSSALLRLSSPEKYEELKKIIENDSRFQQLKAYREKQYWEEQAKATATFIRVLGLFVTFVFSIGAILGAMITMYAQVAMRIQELGILRAIGFSRKSVLGGFLVESVFLGIAGGVIGTIGAFMMRWVKINTVNFQTFSDTRFGFVPTPGILAASLLFGVTMGALGGLLPAARAAKLEVLDAIKQ